MRALTCDDALELLARREESGGLEPGDAARLGEHLTACAACRDLVDAQSPVAAVLGSRPVSVVPVGFDERLAARLAAERSWVGLADWRVWTFRLAPLAAAAALAAFVWPGPARETRAGETAPVASLTAVMETWATGEGAGGRPAASILWQTEAPDDTVLLTVLTAAPDDPMAEPAERGGR